MHFSPRSFLYGAAVAAAGVVLAFSIPSVRDRTFAFAMKRVADHKAIQWKERKQTLFKDLKGRVLEIGPGTGANFAFFPTDGRMEWYGIEPNKYMHSYLKQELAATGFNETLAHFQEGTAAEQMAAFRDGFFDYVISTLVLCSVPDEDAVLREIRRVLKPGGKFLFIEHVGGKSGTIDRFIQDLMDPIWGTSTGCSLVRHTALHIYDAGFRVVDISEWRESDHRPLVYDHISGSATK